MSKVICIDELDKMSGQFQNQLLSLLDSGHIKVDHQRKSYDDDFKIRVSRSLPHVTKLTGYRNLVAVLDEKGKVLNNSRVDNNLIKVNDQK